MASASTKTARKPGRASAGKGSNPNSTPTAASSVDSGTLDTSAGESGDTLHEGDRIIVKYTRHATGTMIRELLPGSSTRYVEYVCDCHKQFRMAKLTNVVKLKPKH